MKCVATYQFPRRRALTNGPSTKWKTALEFPRTWLASKSVTSWWNSAHCSRDAGRRDNSSSLRRFLGASWVAVSRLVVSSQLRFYTTILKGSSPFIFLHILFHTDSFVCSSRSLLPQCHCSLPFTTRYGNSDSFLKLSVPFSAKSVGE